MKKLLHLMLVLVLTISSVSAGTFVGLRARLIQPPETTRENYISSTQLSDFNSENVVEPIYDPIRKRNINPALGETLQTSHTRR